MSDLLHVLRSLIRCDTQNPPREITPDDAIFSTLQTALGESFEFTTTDHDKGRVSVLAVRGNPTTLFNVHLDTVPIGNGWTQPPLELTVVDDKAFGRGACDIKGAAAAMIDAASNTDAAVAILFTTDEEGSESACVRAFCESGQLASFKQVVVAEPTMSRVVLGHRGYLSVTGSFRGESGHTSREDLLQNSANHKAVAWLTEATQRVKTFEENDGSARFNIGRLDGGIKNNMVADRCDVGWSARLPPGTSNAEFLERLTGDQPNATWTVTFDGNPCPQSPALLPITEKRFAERSFGLADPVDFWTEASIFAEFDTPTIVLGPGHISQAHTSDEWVSVEQLKTCAEIYMRIMNITDW